MADDRAALAHLRATLKDAPPDPFARTLSLGRRLPDEARRASPADLVRWLRRRTELTQRQLAALSGLPHSKVARIEAGRMCG